MIPGLIAMLAAQQTILADEGALRAGAPVVRQLLEEAQDAYYQADPARTTFIVSTRPRQTHVGGICARDRMTMVMAPPAAPSAAPGARRARIREIEVAHEFHLLRTEEGAPRWELDNDVLEAACAEAGGGMRWFDAESAEDARAGMLGLAAVVRALGEPNSPLIRARCPGRACFDRQAMARLIAPLDPSGVRRGVARRCGGGGRYRCLQVFIVDIALCGGWQLDMESEWDEPFRLRSATFVQRAGIAIHCGGEES